MSEWNSTMVIKPTIAGMTLTVAFLFIAGEGLIPRRKSGFP